VTAVGTKPTQRVYGANPFQEAVSVTQHRDHRHRPRPPRADDPGQHVTPDLIDSRDAALLVARCG
jgi:hypothetical protein